MSNTFKSDARLYDRVKKTQVLAFDVAITADATPADIAVVSDLPGIVVPRLEGQTSTPDALDDISSLITNAADSSDGEFALILDVVTEAKAPADTAYSVLVSDTGTGTTAVVNYGVTTSGRLWIDLNSDQDLTSQSISFNVVVVYAEQPN